MPYIVVAYDITDNNRRLRVARTLRNALERVQRSVYEGELDMSQVERLLNRIQPLIDEKVDTVRIYILCSACQKRTKILGRGEVIQDPTLWII